VQLRQGRGDVQPEPLTADIGDRRERPARRAGLSLLQGQLEAPLAATAHPTLAALAASGTLGPPVAPCFPRGGRQRGNRGTHDAGTHRENPVLNSPFVEPARHFRTTEDGEVTGEIVARRRPSEFFVPVARPRKSSPQLTLDAFGPPTRQQPNEIVNEIRQAIARWRTQGYPHVTPTTRELLAYWRGEDRERRLFFCQVEAAETAIYLAEAAARVGDTKALNVIAAENARLNDGLPRLALKMATGSGKTVVMAMLIAWQALNKLADPYDRRFSTRFLVVTPGITIRDRLRVLLPNDPGNYYRAVVTTPSGINRYADVPGTIIRDALGTGATIYARP
jgi:hypothetical protein